MPVTSGNIKVCHVASADLWAGAEVQLAMLLAELAKLGDLDVSAILFNDGRLVRELTCRGISTHVIPESGHNFVSIWRQLAAYFERHPIDLLHAHKCKDNVLGALASARCVPWHVRTVHGAPEPFRGFRAAKMSVYETLDRAVNRWCVDRILAVSADLAERLGEQFGSGKVTCIHNGIDLGSIRTTGRSTELRQELSLSPHDVVIGTICRLVPVKGLDVFLRAARLIRDERRHVKFIIVGDGPLKKSLHALAHSSELDDDVRFVGYRDDSYDMVALMDLFVLPSLSEGIPMGLLEALALSKPVVASRVGGVPEVVEHGVTGLLVHPGRHHELARSCLALIDDREVAHRFGAAGRRRVEQKFSAATMAAKVAEMYRTLVWSKDTNEDWVRRVWTNRRHPRQFYSLDPEAQDRRCL